MNNANGRTFRWIATSLATLVVAGVVAYAASIDRGVSGVEARAAASCARIESNMNEGDRQLQARIDAETADVIALRVAVARLEEGQTRIEELLRTALRQRGN